VHQIRFRPELRPGPRWGADSASPDPLAGLRSLTSRGHGRGGKGKRRAEGKSKGKGVNGRDRLPLTQISSPVPVYDCELVADIHVPVRESTMLRAAREDDDAVHGLLFCCLRPLRRRRRSAVQSLVLFVVVVAATVLLSSHHRRTSTGSIHPVANTLRRLVRSVMEGDAGDGKVIEGDDGSNGYPTAAVVNGSRMTNIEFRSYGDAVDLRVIVLAYDRPESLSACLESLEAAEYGDGDRISLHVWIDGCPRNDSDAHARTVDVARSFNFSRGAYHVHVRTQHVGVQVGDVAR